MNYLQCYECNKFMSYSKPYYSFTFYGDCGSLEPPDPLFMHRECYEKKTEESKTSFREICWIKPHLINEGDVE